MESGKVGASRHNARTTPGNNPSPGSKTPEPPSLTGGGGSPYLEETNTYLVDSPAPIKRRARDFCSAGQPCGSLWNTHTNKIALKLHLGYLFGISWPTVVTILRDYGVDHINQNIHDTERFIRDELAQGRTIRSYAGTFIYLLRGALDAEPELSPEALYERDVTLARDFELLRSNKPRKKTEKDKHADAYQKRWGPGR